MGLINLSQNPSTEDNTYNPQVSTKKAMQFGKWSVSLEGDLSFDNGRYEIYSNQLKEKFWIAHLFSKNFIDWNEFIPAYFQGLKNAGIQNIEMLVYYSTPIDEIIFKKAN